MAYICDFLYGLKNLNTAIGSIGWPIIQDIDTPSYSTLPPVYIYFPDEHTHLHASPETQDSN